MLDTLNLPCNPVFGTERFYASDVGDVHFIWLYVPTRTVIELWQASRLEVAWPQCGWLTNELDFSPAIDQPFQPVRLPGAPSLPRVATAVCDQFDLDLSLLQPLPAALFFRGRQSE